MIATFLTFAVHQRRSTLAVPPLGAAGRPAVPTGRFVAVVAAVGPARTMEDRVLAGAPRYRLPDVGRAVQFRFSFDHAATRTAAADPEQTDENSDSQRGHSKPKRAMNRPLLQLSLAANQLTPIGHFVGSSEGGMFVATRNGLIPRVPARQNPPPPKPALGWLKKTIRCAVSVPNRVTPSTLSMGEMSLPARYQGQPVYPRTRTAGRPA